MKTRAALRLSRWDYIVFLFAFWATLIWAACKLIWAACKIVCEAAKEAVLQANIDHQMDIIAEDKRRKFGLRRSAKKAMDKQQ